MISLRISWPHFGSFPTPAVALATPYSVALFSGLFSEGRLEVLITVLEVQHLCIFAAVSVKKVLFYFSFCLKFLMGPIGAFP